MLKADRPQEAEARYRDDLRRHPEHGWVLYGLGEALGAENKDAEARDMQTRFQKAWKNADVTLVASAS